MQNGHIESFNGHMRDELLNGSLDLGQATRGGGIHRSATERRRP
jgi:Integrase core domain